MGKRLSRRQFLHLLWISFLDLLLLAIGGLVYSAWIEPGQLRVETLRLKLSRLPGSLSGTRIAQISDIHMGGWMTAERLQDIADLVRAQNPDILLITGDFLTGHEFTNTTQQAVDDLVNVLTPLAKDIPTFAVLGNHDYWTDAPAVRDMLALCGITELTNTVFTWTREQGSLHLCGVDDVWAGDARLEVVLSKVEDDHAAILLVHEPDFADTSSATDRFDLQVSGHSHGGQVVIPFLGPPVLPYLGNKYPSGLYKVGEMFQYTNRGVGMLSPAVRFNCPPEVTIFVLENAG